MLHVEKWAQDANTKLKRVKLSDQHRQACPGLAMTWAHDPSWFQIDASRSWGPVAQTKQPWSGTGPLVPKKTYKKFWILTAHA